MTRTGAPSLLPLLRSRTQAELLQRLFLQPEREWTVAELAGVIEVTEMTVRRELHRLVDAAVCEVRHVGRTAVYRADQGSPLFEPLQQLVERSVGVEAQLRSFLDGVDGVRAAAIYGSWARGAVDAESDIDLLVIGDVDYGRLVEGLIDLRERVGRDINPVVMRPGELTERLGEGSGFAADLVASPLQPLLGTDALRVEAGRELVQP